MSSPIQRWEWESGGRERAAAEIEQRGFSWFRMPHARQMALAEPWALARTLLGPGVSFLSRTRIRAALGQTIYIEGTGDAMFHTDQDTLDVGIPPYLQSWVCLAQAQDGGASVLLDTWPMLAEIESDDRRLFRALFETTRRLSYPTGSLALPAFSAIEGNLVCTHAARTASDDAVGWALRKRISLYQPVRLRLEPGDVLLNHNHRVLHGRDAFGDTSRELIRTHYWLERPMPAPERWLRYAAEVRARRKLGERAGADAAARWRLGVALEELSLVGFSVERERFAQRTGVDPATARRWRELAVNAALRALSDSQPPSQKETRDVHPIAAAL